MIYKTSEAGVRLIIRTMLSEWHGQKGKFSVGIGPTKGGNYSDNPANMADQGLGNVQKANDKAAKLGEADEEPDEDPMEFQCQPKEGGMHSFHGDRMYPCGEGNDYMNIGSGGPFLGHDVVSQDDIEAADKYLEEWDPDEIVAYSRGGAMAVRSKQRASKYTFLSPAWDRDKFGADADKISGFDGKIYHGAGDRFVPVSHSCRGADSSGMDLYIHPTAGHGKVLGHFKKGDLGDYKKATGDFLKKCSDEAPDWGGTDVVARGSSEQEEQIKWFKNNFFKEGTMKISRKKLRNLIKEIITDVDTGRSPGFESSLPAMASPGLNSPEMEAALEVAKEAIKKIPEVQEQGMFHIDDYIEVIRSAEKYRREYSDILDWMDDRGIIELEGSSGWYHIADIEFFFTPKYD